MATSCATDAFIGRQHALASKTLSPIMAPSSSADDGFLLLISVVSIALIFIAIAPGLLEQQREQLETEFATQVAGSVLKMKRRLEAGPEDPDTQIKRRNIGWDHARARHCIFMDYWGSPYPKFDDRMFERVFRVTRSIAQKILNAICISDPFFTEQPDATGKRGICPKAKLLMGLKILAFGCSPSAFIDYFQMGLTTGRKCLIHLTRFLANDAAIQSVYLRKMSRADAKRVTDMHYRQHGVIGMIGSLDCMHVFWRLCPVAWQGQQIGKEKKPSIVLEAMADYNLWIWHASFGWAGSLNDINIWDRSPLLKSWLDGTFSLFTDFPFSIAGRTFEKLFVLVDGIYPELARFVKTFSEPVGQNAKRFSKWQESSRKDIERAFGVLQRKFHIIVRSFEQWYVEDISDIVVSCIVLHNMMVAHRMSCNENESMDFYDIPPEEDPLEVDPPSHQEEDDVDRRTAEMELHRRLDTELNNESIIPIYQQQKLNRSQLTRLQEYAHRRWETLYDVEEHNRLREAIITHLATRDDTE